MKNLVRHLLENNLDEIVSRSLLNCHCEGVHSIMLSECPGKTIRLYVATEDHELWKNIGGVLGDTLSIGYHPHHCNITLEGVFGTVFNLLADEDPNGIRINKFFFDSKIKGGSGGFVYNQMAYLQQGITAKISKGDSIYLHANTIHTVAVIKGDPAAWFVYEGKENPDYIPYTYSKQNLEVQSTFGLYRKATKNDVMYLLGKVGLI